ncbi:hypothetical protein Hanom_Chr07g00676081 [Helianthus anomalus]
MKKVALFIYSRDVRLVVYLFFFEKRRCLLNYDKNKQNSLSKELRHCPVHQQKRKYSAETERNLKRYMKPLKSLHSCHSKFSFLALVLTHKNEMALISPTALDALVVFPLKIRLFLICHSVQHVAAIMR